jgi:hypothetical protein
MNEKTLVEELVAALQLAKDMILANGLDLPNTMGVVDAALERAKKERKKNKKVLDNLY